MMTNAFDETLGLHVRPYPMVQMFGRSLRPKGWRVVKKTKGKQPRNIRVRANNVVGFVNRCIVLDYKGEALPND